MTRTLPTGTPQRQDGFTLLELMMSLFIISILLVIAIPLYLDYQTRVKLSEGVNIAGALATSISEYHQLYGNFPSNNTVAGLASPVSYQTKWISEIRIVDQPTSGSIQVTYNSAALPVIGSKNTIVFVPDYVGGSIRWDCSYGTVENRFRPRDCQR